MLVFVYVAVVFGFTFAQSEIQSQSENQQPVQSSNTIKVEKQKSEELEDFRKELESLFKPKFAQALYTHLTQKPNPASYQSCADVLVECQSKALASGVPRLQKDFMECHAKNENLHGVAQSFHALTAKLDERYSTMAELCVIPSSATQRVAEKSLYDIDQSHCINHFKLAMDYNGQVKSPMICVLTSKIYNETSEDSYVTQRLKCRDLLKKMNLLARQ